MVKLKLNPGLGVPIYRQIMDGIRDMIATGALKPGDRLWSIREISGELRINPSSAVKAYTELQHAGVIVLDHGRGTFVSQNPDVLLKTRDELLKNDLQALLDRAQARGFAAKDVVRHLKQLVEHQKGERK